MDIRVVSPFFCPFFSPNCLRVPEVQGCSVPTAHLAPPLGRGSEETLFGGTSWVLGQGGISIGRLELGRPNLWGGAGLPVPGVGCDAPARLQEALRLPFARARGGLQYSVVSSRLCPPLPPARAGQGLPGVVVGPLQDLSVHPLGLRVSALCSSVACVQCVLVDGTGAFLSQSPPQLGAESGALVPAWPGAGATPASAVTALGDLAHLLSWCRPVGTVPFGERCACDSLSPWQRIWVTWGVPSTRELLMVSGRCHKDVHEQ